MRHVIDEVKRIPLPVPEDYEGILLDLLGRAGLPLDDSIEGQVVVMRKATDDIAHTLHIVDCVSGGTEVFEEYAQIEFRTLEGYHLILTGDIEDPFDVVWTYHHPKMDGRPDGIPGECEVTVPLSH